MFEVKTEIIKYDNPKRYATIFFKYYPNMKNSFYNLEGNIIGEDDKNYIVKMPFSGNKYLVNKITFKSYN